MILTKENKKYLQEAKKVDFLTEKWERDMYVYALIKADEWSNAIDARCKRVSTINCLVEKYNK